MAVRKPRLRTRVSLRKKKTEMLKSNKNQQQQCTKVTDKSKKALVIAQEIKFARLLADNDKKIRDKVLKNLKKWLTVRSQSSFGKLVLICIINIIRLQYKILYISRVFTH